MADFPDDYRDLLDARFATLATVEPDGTPQLSEIWFLHDDGEIRLSLNTARRKTQNLQARPQCSCTASTTRTWPPTTSPATGASS
jgi:nitroimidazol reductase NimA-like FMN-containing flavoprotein (pyridoxamine 5'-phosphate oxidase superfamily)